MPKQKSLNVLITAASRRVALIRAFQAALKKLDLAGKVVTTDINPLSPGIYVSDSYYWAPITTDPGYLDRLEEICRLENVSVIIPTIDDELETMGEAKERFASQGVQVIISPPQTARICNDKWETFRFFRERGIPTPQTWLPADLPSPDKLGYPMFLKPRHGRGSVHTFRIRNRRELEFFTGYVKKPIVQEFLEDDEYTLDTFVDSDGEVVAVVPRRRLWIRAGVMDKGRTERREELIELGVRVARELKIVGPANIQVKYAGSTPMVFEVNPRFSGGIPLTLAAGVDFPLMTLKMASGEKLPARLGDFTDGLVMMSYENSVFRVMEVDDYGEIINLLDHG